MLLGEVKAEALRIMNVNPNMQISYLDIDGLKNDPTYVGYLSAMPGAINRAFDRFFAQGVLKEEVQGVDVNTKETVDLKETYGISEALCRMIPLFVVGDVFAMDEPSVAAANRNLFEMSLEEYKNGQRNQQTQVETIYRVDI